MNTPSDKLLQQRYARIAGFVYLLLIVLFMSGELTITGMLGSGEFVDLASNAQQGERTYRIALVLQALSSISTVVLAYALFAVVRPINENLARMAMFWRLGESFIGATAAALAFAKLKIYLMAAGGTGYGIDASTADMALVRVIHSVLFNLSTMFFAVGSTLFFYLFSRSDYLPKSLSVFGLAASLIAFATGSANLILPEFANIVHFGWLPVFAAEIVIGFWLLFKGIRISAAPT